MAKTKGASEAVGAHTKTPWVVLPGTAKVLAGKVTGLHGYEGFPIAWPAKGMNRAEAVANARRIAALANALEGVRTEDLEAAAARFPNDAAARLRYVADVVRATKVP